MTRQMPHSAEAETGVLSSMMHGAVAEAVQAIGDGAGWFHNPLNWRLYSALVTWWEKGKPFNLELFTKWADDLKMLPSIGGPVHITETYTFAHSAALFGHYLESLTEKRWLRYVITTCQEQVARAYDNQDDVAGILSAAEAALLDIVNRSARSQKQRGIHTIIGDVIHNLSDREKVLGISTGWKSLDAVVGGLAPTAKIVVGGATSGGKSAFAQCIANSVAVDRKIPTAFFTYEMSAEEAAMRLIQIRSEVSTRAVADGSADMMEMDCYNRAATEIASSPLHIVEEQLDIAGIRARCMSLKPRVAIIDYLQVVPEKWRAKEGTTEHLDRMSMATKQIAQQLGITVIELTQLTVNEKTGKITTRFSAGITNDANQLWILEGEDDESKAVIPKTLTVGKQRDGARAPVQFLFSRRITKFKEPK